jgi:polyhydroxybutyrate depolymerase
MKRVARHVAAVLIVIIVVAACSADRPSADRPSSVAPLGATHASLRFGGVTRTYRLYVPDAPGPMALVVALHGGLGSGDQLAETTQFEPLADREHFVVVFPDGVGATWNAGTCCGTAVTRKVDDVAFLVALVDEIARTVSIDRTRVFAVGHSNGAMMAFRLGCEAGNVFAAVVAVAGSLEIDRCAPTRPVALLASMAMPTATIRSVAVWAIGRFRTCRTGRWRSRSSCGPRRWGARSRALPLPERSRRRYGHAARVLRPSTS